MFAFRVSTKRGKKYDAVFDDGRVVSFGAIKKDGVPYAQFRDRTNIKAFKQYDHNDTKRRDRYYKRHGAINESKPYTPDWFSKKYLW